jgi:HlyD family secretion protein
VDKIYDDLSRAHGTNFSDETQTQKMNREQAEMARDMANQDYQSAQKALQFSSIVAPFDGMVSDISGIAVGQNITAAGGSSVTVVGDGKLKFVANVDETEYGRLKLGQVALITLDAFPNEKFSGQISKFGVSAIKLQTGGSVVPVELTLPDDSRLKNGLNGEAEFTITAKRNVLTLPRSAVKTAEGSKFVYLFINNKPQKQPVTVGENLGAKTEITSGIKPGDVVVVSEVKP